jgi:hypothetical protein
LRIAERYEEGQGNTLCGTPGAHDAAQRIRADWKGLMAKVLCGVLTNIPYLGFLVLLAVIYIANNHRAVGPAAGAEQGAEALKELRWRYMDTKTRLMNAGMETEIIRSGARSV